jgi:homoserine O-acetyltransferase
MGIVMTNRIRFIGLNTIAQRYILNMEAGKMSGARQYVIALFLVLSAGPSSLLAQTRESAAPVLPGQTEGDFTIKDFHFNSGEVLPELRMHYVTLGTPRRGAAGDIDNAALLLHATGGGAASVLSHLQGPLFGPGQSLDLTRWYLIVPDSIGHGKSSKPSDGMRAHFPHYGYEDMVAAQHRLVTEKLGVAHLRLVIGMSMGAMHTWLWGERYPEMMDSLFPIGSLPVETSGRNRLWRHVIVEAIRNDPEWKNGDYQEQPHSYSRVAPMVAMMTGNPVRQFEAYPTRAAADAWYQRLTASASQVDVNDALYWYEASSDYNPGPDLEKIKAKLLAIEFEDDQINAPEFAALDREMPRVKNGRYVIIPTLKQSNGEAGNIANGDLWVAHLQDLLGSLTP